MGPHHRRVQNTKGRGLGSGIGAREKKKGKAELRPSRPKTPPHDLSSRCWHKNLASQLSRRTGAQLSSAHLPAPRHALAQRCLPQFLPRAPRHEGRSGTKQRPESPSCLPWTRLLPSLFISTCVVFSLQSPDDPARTHRFLRAALDSAGKAQA